jgi:hypothetical protein
MLKRGAVASGRNKRLNRSTADAVTALFGPGLRFRMSAASSMKPHRRFRS